jgi:hypothetical protein
MPIQQRLDSSIVQSNQSELKRHQQPQEQQEKQEWDQNKQNGTRETGNANWLDCTTFRNPNDQ